MCNRGRTNDDGKCRFHPTIQLNLLTRKGEWLQIVKECPLCLTQVSSSPQLFLPSKSMVNRHDTDYVESKFSVCRINDEVCYVNIQTERLQTEPINDLIHEVKSMQLITRQETASTTNSSFSISQDTASTTKSSFSRLDDDNSHTQSYSVPVSCIRRIPSNGGSDTDSSSAPLSSSYSYSTCQDSDCNSSFGSCDTLGRCIYHPNIQLKTLSTCEGLKTGKWKTVVASCSECAREEGQRNILNSLTSSEKDLMNRLLSSCKVDRSDRTDSIRNRRVSFAEQDDIITFWL